MIFTSPQRLRQLKYRLIDLLACPSCGFHPFELKVLAADHGAPVEMEAPRCDRFCSRHSTAIENLAESIPSCGECYSEEITQGILRCGNCKHKYPVIDGVPRFNPDARDDYPEFFTRYEAAFRNEASLGERTFRQTHGATKRSFGFQWLRYRVTNHEENIAHFFRRTGLERGRLGDQLFFEAGCGMGRYLRVIGDEPPAEVVGLDLSLAVNRAHEENRENPFVHVIQGNIMQLPLRKAVFDHVYSIGVLHHTPSTKEAFQNLTPIVRPGGRISVWVYHTWCSTELSGPKAIHARVKGWINDVLRALTTRLPFSILHYVCYLAVPLGWVQRQIDRLPGPLKALLSPIMLIPCSVHRNWRIRILDTFDWYSPRYQWKHTVDEVAGWFHEAGCTDISTTGFPVSVRGVRPESPVSVRPSRERSDSPV